MKRVLAYRYRWVVLVALVALLFSVEIQWMSFSPVARIANDHFRDVWKARTITISDLMSFIFMGGFVLFAIPCSFFINKFGIVKSVRLSSSLVLVATFLKMMNNHSIVLLLSSQVLFSIAQAIVLNLGTATVAEWFPIRERGMAMGILSAFQYIALGFVMVFSPYLMRDGSFDRMLGIYGVISLAGGLVSALLIREKPPTPSSLIKPSDLSYLKALLKVESMGSLRGIVVVFGISWGVLMAILVRIDFLASQLDIPTVPFSLSLLGSGAVGAIALPALSDHFRKRKFFYSLCFACALPGILLLAFARNPVCSYIGIVLLGFFGFGSIPLGLQYGAELGSASVDEEIVQVWMTFFSQAIGAVILLVTMNSDNLAFRGILGFYIGLLFACFLGSTFLVESKMIVTEEERLGQEINKEIVQNE
jgi:MFS family permease